MYSVILASNVYTVSYCRVCIPAKNGTKVATIDMGQIQQQYIGIVMEKGTVVYTTLCQYKI